METTPTQADDKNVTHQYFNMSAPVTQADTSVTDWLVTFVVMLIPLVNLIMLLVWAFGSGTQASRSNWAKALLLWGLIITALYVLLFSIIGISLLSLFQ